MDVFRGRSRLFDLASDAEYHNLKNLTWEIPDYPIREISMKICTNNVMLRWLQGYS